MCRFVIKVLKKSYQITIVSPGGEKMIGEKRQKSFLHGGLKNYMIRFKEGMYKKLLNRKNVAYDESFLTINMKCLCNKCL